MKEKVSIIDAMDNGYCITMLEIHGYAPKNNELVILDVGYADVLCVYRRHYNLFGGGAIPNAVGEDISPLCIFNKKDAPFKWDRTNCYIRALTEEDMNNLPSNLNEIYSINAEKHTVSFLDSPEDIINRNYKCGVLLCDDPTSVCYGHFTSHDADVMYQCNYADKCPKHKATKGHFGYADYWAQPVINYTNLEYVRNCKFNKIND